MPSNRTLDIFVAAGWADIYDSTLTTFTKNTALASATDEAMKPSSRAQRMALLKCYGILREIRGTYIKQ